MASRPPLGIALSDQLGVPQPHYSKGQIIAGIIADALAGAAGQPGPMAARWNQERQQQNEDVQWGRRLQMTKAMQAPYRWEANDGSLMEMGPDGQPRMVYKDTTPKANLDPDVFTTLPNGQFYAGPRSGLTAALTGGGQSAQLPAVGSVVPDPRKGGPTQPASGGFPTSYPNIGPYKRY
jgi:hypothetical protein